MSRRRGHSGGGSTRRTPRDAAVKTIKKGSRENTWWDARRAVEKEEMGEWGTRRARDRKKKKEDVGMEKGREKEEGEELASFFGAIHEFFNPVPVPVIPIVPVNALVPVVLPARFVLVPASSPNHCITTRSTA